MGLPGPGVELSKAAGLKTKGSLAAPLAIVSPLSGGNGHPLPEPRLLSLCKQPTFQAQKVLEAIS